MTWVRNFILRAKGFQVTTGWPKESGDWRAHFDDDQLDMGSFVYFIQTEPGGAIKIGYSNKPTKRVADLQTANPKPLIVLGMARGGAPLEAKLHIILAAYRQQGERFTPTDYVVRVVYTILNSRLRLGAYKVESLELFTRRVRGVR